MKFADVAGQNKLKEKLCRSVSNGRVAHAQMFVGPTGAGPLPLALAFAQFLACKDRVETDSCGECISCKRFEKLEHPDLQLIFPKNKTSKVTHQHFSSKDFVTEWRSAVMGNPYLNLNEWLGDLGIENKQGSINVDDAKEILQNLSYKPYEADHRVVLIWLVEQMNISSANKLLKVLEEPPEKTVFLLIAEDTENLLQTIISRVQIHRMERLSEDAVVEKLAFNGMEEEGVRKFAHMADGDLTLTKELLENQESITSSIRFFIKWMRACYGGQMNVIRDLSDECHAMGREQQKELLIRSGGIVRKVMMYRVLPESKDKLLQEEMSFVQKFSPFITPENAPDLLTAISDASYHIERNANPRITFTDLSFKISEMIVSEAMK
ncbi:MAG: hypothetical protein QF371_06245 [Flavobacteriales bacterium]|nr:hypothetical protein [Flavobacteriales bacterium]